MKYNIGDAILINNTEWVVSEYRMGRGREYRYTLSYENKDGSFETMSINEKAVDSLVSTSLVGSKNEI